MKVKGILENVRGSMIIYLYDSEEEREEVWNTRTPVGRKRVGWKKVLVEIEEEK